jgi:hypothetical protein
MSCVPDASLGEKKGINSEQQETNRKKKQGEIEMNAVHKVVDNVSELLV